MINRINKIKAHRIFRAFTWPADLHPFGQFNLIYGWNGTGKTALSSLFCHLQTRSAITEGEVEFEIEGAKVSGSAFATAQLPEVRVFNSDFIASTILAAGKQMDPIYYLGEDSVKKRKQVTTLKEELAVTETKQTRARSDQSLSEKALDDFCISKAKVIKELLISARAVKYNNYDKRSFKQAIEMLTESSATAALLVDEDKEGLRKQKDAQPKDAIPLVTLELPDFDRLAVDAETLLKRSVVSQVLDELAADSDVGSWVQRGLSLHSGDRKTDVCRFCGQSISASRVQELQAHFNDAFTTFQQEVARLAQRVESLQALLEGLQFPESSRLYDHLATELQPTALETRRLLDKATAYLGLVHGVLLRKQESLFETISLENALIGKPSPDRTALIKAIGAVNAVIEKHNTITEDFQSQVQKASEALEQCYVAEAFPKYRRLTDQVSACTSALQACVSECTTLSNKIAAIEREIVEHRRPAEELNAELCSYLGRNDLRLEVKESGYAMRRGKQPATDLSEGEKTAIAFLYFLKSLQDKSFDLAKGVVVVDDPVSSLDGNALFSAFGYMKERTKAAGQLFVLTHSFGFFRQVKNWFHHLPNQKKNNPNLRPGRFFMLHTVCPDGERTAVLAALDKLLEEYESEYHYLFKRIHVEAHREDAHVLLENYYGVPNQARRLLETFLAFRYPDVPNDVSKKIDRVTFDSGKKTRILRFLHTYSHSGSIAEPEHDPSILSETKAVLSDLLDLIKECDPTHYDGMMRIVAPREATTDE